MAYNFVHGEGTSAFHTRGGGRLLNLFSKNRESSPFSAFERGKGTFGANSSFRDPFCDRKVRGKRTRVSLCCLPAHM